MRVGPQSLSSNYSLSSSLSVSSNTAPLDEHLPGHPSEPEIVPGNPHTQPDSAPFKESPAREVPEITPLRSKPEISTERMIRELDPRSPPEIGMPEFPSENPADF